MSVKHRQGVVKNVKWRTTPVFHRVIENTIKLQLFYKTSSRFGIRHICIYVWFLFLAMNKRIYALNTKNTEADMENICE